MYRESFDSMAAEIARLHAELERLRADAEATRQMTAPKRALRVVGAVLVAAAVAANFFAILASKSYRHEVSECRLENRVLASELSQSTADLGREVGARIEAEVARSKEWTRADKTLQMYEACRSRSPEF